MSTNKRRLLITLFFGFWSLLTLAFDATIFYTTFRRIRAQGYATTLGTITHSEVIVRTGEGTSYNIMVRYNYQVDRHQYEGTRYRYGSGDSSRYLVRKIVDSLPVGKKVDIFYNQGDPSDSVLRTGIEGNDLFMALFLTPFNLVMLGSWGGFAAALFPRLGIWLLCRPRSVGRGARRRLVLLPAPSLVLAALTLGFGAFLSIIPVAIPFGFNPPMGVVIAVWAGVLGLATAAFLWRPGWTMSGKRLFIDEYDGTLTVTESIQQRKKTVIPLRAIGDIGATHGKVGHEVVLIYDDERGNCRERLIEVESAEHAMYLVHWVKDQVSRSSRQCQTRRAVEA